MRIQKSFKGKIRKQVSSGLAKKLNGAVEKEAQRYDCSKSFVIANCIGFALNISLDESYK